MLEQRGFKYITGNKNSMGYVYSYWWHSRDKNCVQVEVYNGMVETINDAKNSDCNGMDTLASRGFVQVDNFTSGSARYSIQWRGQSRQCLQVIVADGRLENITDIQTHPKCR